MNKSVWTTIILAILFASGAFLFMGKRTEPVVVTDVPTATSTSDVATSSPAATSTRTFDISNIDYSSLEKDRLYTEEEGGYENLSEEGKRLMRTILGTTECIVDEDKCYTNEIIYSAIVSLKDDVLLLRMPTIRGNYYKIYDLNRDIESTYRTYNFESPLEDDQFVVIVNQNYKQDNTRLDPTNQDILYFRQGMRGFKPVPDSDIPQATSDSYLYEGGAAGLVYEASLNKHILTIAVFSQMETGLGVGAGFQKPEKLREATFDLSELP